MQLGKIYFQPRISSIVPICYLFSLFRGTTHIYVCGQRSHRFESCISYCPPGPRSGRAHYVILNTVWKINWRHYCLARWWDQVFDSFPLFYQTLRHINCSLAIASSVVYSETRQNFSIRVAHVSVSCRWCSLAGSIRTPTPWTSSTHSPPCRPSLLPWPMSPRGSNSWDKREVLSLNWSMQHVKTTRKKAGKMTFTRHQGKPGIRKSPEFKLKFNFRTLA